MGLVIVHTKSYMSHHLTVCPIRASRYVQAEKYVHLIFQDTSCLRQYLLRIGWEAISTGTFQDLRHIDAAGFLKLWEHNQKAIASSR